MAGWYLAIVVLTLGGTVRAQFGLFNYGMDLLGVTDTVNQLQKSIQDTHQSIMDQYNGARKAVGSTVSYVMNEVDGAALEETIGELVPELDEGMGNGTCVEGLHVKLNGQGSVRLTKGKMTFYEPMELELETTTGLDDKVWNVTVKFFYPDLDVFYDWTYRADGMYERERAGTMKLRQPGPNVFEAAGNVTRTRSELNEAVDHHECFLKLWMVDVHLGDAMTVEDINYGSLFKDIFGTGYTESAVSKIVNDVSGTLQVLFKKSLREAVSPALKNDHVFCGNDDVIKVLTDVVKCDAVSELGSYDN